MERGLRPPSGAKHQPKRVGRGDGSGHGTYSGRGLKGQKSRSGGGVRLGFEGGQLPLIKRLSKKRGFINIFKTTYSLVKLRQLNVFPAHAQVTPEEMVKVGLVRNLKDPVKILGDGEIAHPLYIKASKFSRVAERKITDAGGGVEVI